MFPLTRSSAWPRIAIVHEWIDAYAGSEQVFEAIAQTYPAADLYALSQHPGVDLELDGRPVTTTFLDRPGVRDRRGATLPLMPLAWRALGRGQYDLVLSSHHAFAHTNQLARPGGKHLAYVHSPARYIWSPDIDERGDSWYLGPAKALLRKVDYRAAQKVSSYAANSSAVAGRISNFWQRDASIIHPPVRVDYFGRGDTGRNREYVLGVGRWIPYKNLHLVIEAASIAGFPVKVAGRGPDKSRLVAAAAAANVPVQLIESPSDEELRSLYEGALCLVFPTIEDFGIVPVEAQAAGTPVVAPALGGALDTVIPDQTGILVPNLDARSLAEGIKRAVSISGRDACIINAERFGVSRFRERLVQWVDDFLDL